MHECSTACTKLNDQKALWNCSLKDYANAIIIQLCEDGYGSLIDLEEIEERMCFHAAAAIIQSNWRGYSTRKRYLELKSPLLSIEPLVDEDSRMDSGSWDGSLGLEADKRYVPFHRMPLDFTIQVEFRPHY